MADSYRMPYYHESESLHSITQNPPASPFMFFTRVLGDVFLGLEYIHSQNIVHMDMKPENILIKSDHRAVIIDFGVAANANSPTDWLGTIEYSSPETLLPNVERPGNMMHRAAPADDIFSFGLVCKFIIDYQVNTMTALKKFLVKSNQFATESLADKHLKELHNTKDINRMSMLFLTLYQSSDFHKLIKSQNPKFNLPYLETAVDQMIQTNRGNRITLQDLGQTQFFQTALSVSRYNDSQTVTELKQKLEELTKKENSIVTV